MLHLKFQNSEPSNDKIWNLDYRVPTAIAIIIVLVLQEGLFCIMTLSVSTLMQDDGPSIRSVYLKVNS
jgi:hypothetical protein